MKLVFYTIFAFLMIPVLAVVLAGSADCVLAQTQEFSQSSTATVIIGQPPASVPCGWPTSGSISTLFGDPTDFPLEPSHLGIDIVPLSEEDLVGGQEVFSTVTGIVEHAWWDTSCGGKINILSTVGETTYFVRFVHLSQSTVNSWQGRIGTPVTAGTLLGRTHVGSFDGGCSTGTHLHYEVYVNGALVDPMGFTPGGNLGSSVTAGGCWWTPQQ